jgi:hypothetical protein
MPYAPQPTTIAKALLNNTVAAVALVAFILFAAFLVVELLP